MRKNAVTARQGVRGHLANKRQPDLNGVDLVISYADHNGAGLLMQRMKAVPGSWLRQQGRSLLDEGVKQIVETRQKNSMKNQHRASNKPNQVKTRISKFLQSPVPPWPSKDIESWKALAKQLGSSSPHSFLNALRYETANGQYVALLTLRQIGYDATAEGYGKDLYYKVTSPEGLSQSIKPTRSESKVALLRIP